MKKLNNIPQQGFVYNVINKLINAVNELIETGGGGVVPQWLIDLVNSKASQEQVDNIEENKADKDGVYRTLTAGNLIGRDGDDTKDTNSSFVYRTTGGDANLADAAGKLLKVEGNVAMIVDGENYTLEPFSATKFKSYGFNHFNPIADNIILGHELATGVDGKAYVASTDMTNAIMLVKCVACDANIQAGYEITFADGSTFVVDKVAFSKLKPTTESTGMTILEEGVHRNSTSYLPTEDGWLAINLYRPISIEVIDCAEVCVHICWSGYNDGKFEAWEEATAIDVPVQLVHDWGLGAAGNVRDIINYEAKTWTKKVDRTMLEMEVEDYPRTPVVKSDDSLRLYELNDVSGVTLVNGQIGGSISIEITNINDDITRTATFVSREGSFDTWKYTEYETQEDPEAEPIATEYTIVTDITKYYEGKPTTGRYVLYSQVITNAKPNTTNAYHVVIPMMDADVVEYHIGGGDWKIDENRKLRINFSSRHDEGATYPEAITDLVADLESDYTYYELETPESGSFDVNNISERWDFGVEFFDEYLHELGELYDVAGYNVSNIYTNFMIDDLRSLIRRDLQDKVKNIYVIETSTIPTGTYTFTAPMTAENTLWHYHHEATGETTIDAYYQYNNGTYSTVSYKVRPNYYHIWQGTITDLVITLEAIASEDAAYYNEYMIEFTTAATGTPTVTFPTNLKWNVAPNIETGHTYQICIVNGIGCICADNETIE